MSTGLRLTYGGHQPRAIEIIHDPRLYCMCVTKGCPMERAGWVLVEEWVRRNGMKPCQ